MSKEEQRFYLLFRRFKKLVNKLALRNKIKLDTIKLYQASVKYWEDTRKVKDCFPCGKTNESKQCVLTVKAINTYRPIEILSGQKVDIDFNLLHINELFALYCGFSFIESESFSHKFMFEEDLIYLLENSQINYEQLMITLNIFYKDYS